jgi:sterol 24-C-methyltransferase
MNYKQKKTYFLLLVIFIIIIYLIYILIHSEKFKALYRLCNLDKQKIELYYDSYNKIFNDQKMISTLEDYGNNKPPATFTIPEEKKPSAYTAECYQVLNDLCALGNVKKMYIPRMINSKKGLIDNQTLYERHIARTLNVKPGDKLLEIGCGCGRISYNISKTTKCQVYGINIDNKQLNEAREFSKKKKVNNKFIFQDLNDTLAFPDNTFNAIYEFGGFTSFISNYDKVFSEMYRVLKPGGIFFISDAVLLDNFCSKNKQHLKLMVYSRMVMGGAVFLHYKYFEKIAKRNGFKIISSKGGNPPNLAPELPLLIKEHNHFDKIQKIIYFCTRCKIIPSHMYDLILRLRKGGNDLVEMEKQNLLTMDWEFYFMKPTK